MPQPTPQLRSALLRFAAAMAEAERLAAGSSLTAEEIERFGVLSNVMGKIGGVAKSAAKSVGAKVGAAAKSGFGKVMDKTVGAMIPHIEKGVNHVAGVSPAAAKPAAPKATPRLPTPPAKPVHGQSAPNGLIHDSLVTNGFKHEPSLSKGASHIYHRDHDKMTVHHNPATGGFAVVQHLDKNGQFTHPSKSAAHSLVSKGNGVGDMMAWHKASKAAARPADKPLHNTLDSGTFPTPVIPSANSPYKAPARPTITPPAAKPAAAAGAPPAAKTAARPTISPPAKKAAAAAPAPAAPLQATPAAAQPAADPERQAKLAALAIRDSLASKGAFKGKTPAEANAMVAAEQAKTSKAAPAASVAARPAPAPAPAPAKKPEPKSAGSKEMNEHALADGAAAPREEEAAKPAAKSTAKAPAKKPAAKPTAKPAAKATAKVAAKPTAKAAAKKPAAKGRKPKTPQERAKATREANKASARKATAEWHRERETPKRVDMSKTEWRKPAREFKPTGDSVKDEHARAVEKGENSHRAILDHGFVRHKKPGPDGSVTYHDPKHGTHHVKHDRATGLLMTKHVSRSGNHISGLPPMTADAHISAQKRYEEKDGAAKLKGRGQELEHYGYKHTGGIIAKNGETHHIFERPGGGSVIVDDKTGEYTHHHANGVLKGTGRLVRTE